MFLVPFSIHFILIREWKHKFKAGQVEADDLHNGWCLRWLPFLSKLEFVPSDYPPQV